MRLARPASGDLLARRIATLDYGFYATRQVAAGIAAGDPPVFIGFDDASDYVSEAAWAKRFLAGQTREPANQ